MTETIKPALSDEQWRDLRALLRVDRHETMERRLMQWYASADVGALVATMAMANVEIPDGDARKFTREDVELLVEMAGLATGSAPSGYQVRTRAIAQRIASLLPPEKAK